MPKHAEMSATPKISIRALSVSAVPFGGTVPFGDMHAWHAGLYVLEAFA